ncbi:MAG: molecular chaperone DnaJ [Candidatus Marsarchaeota archaeon]|jgi:molecular chaperone DnaJ|nr:molecular chaperone DnaJ [Candidatus Marsarchaeota archaeon]
MSDNDYYKILGIKKDASIDEIKRKYRELALKYHPDRNKDKNAEENFKKINEAYAVLSDPEKRRNYDTFGPEGFNKRFSEEDIFRGFDINDILKDFGFNFESDSNNIFDIFGFGQNFDRNQSKNIDVGNDLLTSVDISLDEAAKGAEKTIFIKHVVKCERCNGTGAEPNSKIITCDKCDGTGQVKLTRRTPFGILQTISTCPKCKGTGKTFEKACRICNGAGRTPKNDKLTIKIPIGVDSGSRLRLKGVGDYGRDKIGDLYVDINVLKDKIFEREGDDIYINVHIPFYTALLGGNTNVETLNGDEIITVKPGTQSGDTLVLKGKGIQHFNSNYTGNEIIKFIVDIPKHLTNEQKALIEKFKELDSGKKKGSIFGFVL